MLRSGLSISWIQRQFVSTAVGTGYSQCRGQDHLVSSLHSLLILFMCALRLTDTGTAINVLYYSVCGLCSNMVTMKSGCFAECGNEEV